MNFGADTKLTGFSCTAFTFVCCNDVMTPGIDGFEIVRRLRGAGNQVPVIFLTAKDARDDKVTGLTIGGDDYLTKPFTASVR